MSGLTDAQTARIEALARLLREVREGGGRAVALTGAGVSTDSGIPDFRSAQSGLWREHDPMEIASVEGFQRDPRRFYDFWGERFARLGDARPNATHRALAALEGEGLLAAVVTQNIDGLHGDAGSKRVLEVHGSYRRARCIGCGRVEALDEVVARLKTGRLPICQACGDLVKPDVVLFGELLPPVFGEAQALAKGADLLVVLGSSLAVYPVAGLVADARAVALVNRDPGPFDEDARLVLHAELTPAMHALAETLGLSFR